MKKKILSLLLIVLLLVSALLVISCDNGGGETEEVEYTVKFDVNGGDKLKKSRYKILEGELIEEYPAAPTREGYEFLGWYYDDVLWNFEEDIVEEDMELVAKWQEKSKICAWEDHDWEPVGREEPTCLKAGYIDYKCKVCEFTNRESLKKLGHDLVQEHVDATCGTRGYDREYCRNAGCTHDFTTNEVLPSGLHQYDETTYILVREPSNYLDGREETRCMICGSVKGKAIPALKSAQFASINIGSYSYTGGKYTTATPFVNLSTYGVATFSSHYAVCVGSNAIDGSVTSYWSADTLADGSTFTGDWLAVELEDTTDIGCVQLVVPNYNLWGLGENCYISFDIEAYIDQTDDGVDNPTWVKVGSVTDKGSSEKAQNVRLVLELAEPVTTNKMRAVVTNSLRYAPAMIYEMEVYGYVSKVERSVQSVASEASYTVTGKYNSYAGGADKLYDGSEASGWMTNAREWMRGGRDVTAYEHDLGGETKLTKVTVNAKKLVGETVTVKYLVEKTVGEKVESSWEVLATFTIDAGAADDVALVKDCDITTKKLRFEVDNYGDWDKEGARNTITDIVLTTADGDAVVAPSWVLPATTKATIKFPASRYVACVEWITGYTVGREFLLEIKATPDGEWQEYGTFLLEQPNNNPNIEERVIAGKSGAVITVDLDMFVSEIRITLTKERVDYDSYVYEFTPYAIVEKGVGINSYEGCKHALASRSDNVIIAPTCDKAGYQDTVCITPNCGFKYRTDATDCTGHKWGDWGAYALGETAEMSQQIRFCEIDDCGEPQIRSFKKGSEPATITDWLNDGTAAWTQSLDDGNYLSTYEWGMKFFPKYNCKGTAMLTIGMMDVYVENWKTYIASGAFDIGSHSTTHDSIYNSIISEKGGLAEVDYAYFWLMATFPGSRVMGFATPMGATSNSAAGWVTGVHGGGRNGGGTATFYKTYDMLTNRVEWGNLNSYISKADQTEGVYEYVAKGTAEHNWVYDAEANKLVDQPTIEGTYFYIADEYKYEWREVGSYDKQGDSYVFRNDNEGEYVYVHSEKGSYEKGIDTLVAANGWTVECLHEVRESKTGIGGVIHSSYDSTISKLEYLTKTGVWIGSYTEVIQYIKENQTALVSTESFTDTSFTLSLTDARDNEFFNQALTIKLDIPDDWNGVSATQDGEAIDSFVKTVDGNKFAFVNAVPDAGEIVVVKN